MEETLVWTLRLMGFVGIGLFLWSVSSSLEQIAKAFTRMADAMQRDRPAPPPPTNRE